MHPIISENNFNLSNLAVSLKISSIDDISLEYSEEMDMFRVVLENHHDPVFLLKLVRDPYSLTLLDFNKYFYEHSGLSKEELFKLNPRNIFATEYIPHFESIVKKHDEENSIAWEAVIIGKNQQRVPVEIKSYVFRNEKYRLLFVFFRDLSSHKNSIQELHKHKTLLERSENIGKTGYWDYDIITNKLWVSAGARVIYGYENYELTLNDIKIITFAEYRPMLNQMFDNLILKNNKYDVEFKIRRHSNGEIADIRSIAEYNINEKKIYGIIQDITHQKKEDIKLKEAKNNAFESDR